MKKTYHVSRITYHESGQILMLAIIVVGLVLVNAMLIMGGAMIFSQSSHYNLTSSQATNLAEAGLDKALAALNKSGGTYNGESETVLGSGSYSVTVTSKSQTTSEIQSIGYIPNKTNPKVKRTINIQVSKGVGISFVYGMLIGNGGITMGNGSSINGSVYSNGNIVGGNNESIGGDVFVAGGTQPTANQETDCTSPSCSDYIFGKNVSGQNRLDIAQSFRPTTSAVINKVSLKLKKVGAPSNITVRLLGDSSGKPNKNNVLASGVLSANLVTDQYGFVDVAFTTSPNLTAETPYWILLDTSSDSSNYWTWSMDTSQSYTRGSPAWSDNWQAGNPDWTAITGDLGFKTWMGGVVTSVSMNNGSIIDGNVHANTISGVTIKKDAFYQVISNSTVVGSSHPNSADPAPIAMPISEANITQWQTDAQSYGVTTGNISGCPSTMGPGKIVGNVSIGNNCNVTVKTPVWITGNVSTGNSVIFRMDASLGATSGVMIVNGTTTFSNGDDLLGTGAAGSYLTLLSTYDSQSNGIVAINTNNSSITGILYAPYGKITLANNATFKEVVAWQINMGTGTVLTYDSGLVSTFFSTGPGGSYEIIKGTYQIK